MDKNTIKIKEESKTKLLKAVGLINKHSNKKINIVDLIESFADAFDAYDFYDAVATASWMVKASPILLNSDASKHYRELKQYEPLEAINIVTNFIRNEAMSRRYGKVIEQLEHQNK